MFATICFLLSVFITTTGNVFNEASAEQMPSFNTVKYSNASHRTDLCVRQRMLYNGQIQLREALAGLNLSVVLTNLENTADEHLFSLSDDGSIRRDYPGLFAVLLDKLSERAGFTWRNNFGVYRPRNDEEDGNRTWTDLLEWTIDSYDISASIWMKSTERINRGISFPEGWYDHSIILVDRAVQASESEKKFDPFSFLAPFDNTVWYVIAAAIVYTGLVYFFLERLDVNADARNLDHSPGGAIFLSAVVFTSHFEFRPNSHAARILAWSWTFWAVIVGSAYTANLASFLVARNAPDAGVQSIDSAVKAGTPICIQKGAMQDGYMNHYYPRANMVRKDLEEDVFRGLWTGDCDMAAVPVESFERFEKLSSINEDCSLRWTGRAIHNVNAGFATSVDTGTLCTSLISHAIDIHMLEMKAEGVLDAAWQEFFRWSTDQTCSAKEPLESADEDSSGEVSGKLTLTDIGGIFFFHLILSHISIVMALSQYFFKKSHFSSKQKSSNKGDESGDPVVNDAAGEGGRSIIWGKERGTLWDSEAIAVIDSKRARSLPASTTIRSKETSKRNESIWVQPDNVAPVVYIVGNDQLRESDMGMTSHQAASTVRRRPTASSSMCAVTECSNEDEFIENNIQGD